MDELIFQIIGYLIMIFFWLFLPLSILLGIVKYILKTMDRKKRRQKIVEDWYYSHYPHGDDGKIYEDEQWQKTEEQDGTC